MDEEKGIIGKEETFTREYYEQQLNEINEQLDALEAVEQEQTDQKNLVRITDLTKEQLLSSEFYEKLSQNEAFRDSMTRGELKNHLIERSKVLGIYKEVNERIKETEKVISQRKAAALRQACLVKVSDIERKPAEWLIDDYIPKYEITTIAGDGGTGKTYAVCAIIAAITTGKHSFLTSLIDQRTKQPEPPRNVMFFSSEDSFSYTLRARLEKNGADLDKVLTIPLASEAFKEIKFNTDFLENLLAENKPALVVFDPLQSFLDPKINMGSRNEMRDALNSLITYGERYGCTFIICCHTNKRENASDRMRIADSADLWDLSRSVIMIGKTQGGRYLSLEKANYVDGGPESVNTIIYGLQDGVPSVISYTDKKDAAFQSERRGSENRTAPAKDEAKDFIMDTLKSGKLEIKELDEIVKSAGISQTALRRAKKELKETKVIKMWNTGQGKDKKWMVSKSEEKEKADHKGGRVSPKPSKTKKVVE